MFGCDPISHTIVGDSLADYVQDVQKFKTNMMRGVFDSLAESINPKSAINELVVDMDDALNDDVGGIIRVRGNPGDAISYVTTPFAGQQALPVIELMNDVLQRRTGMSDAAKGLDPKQLQSSTQVGVEAIINGQQERTELIARVLAETGFKDLFEGLYNEIAESPNQRRTLRINGKWTPIDTSTFDASHGRRSQFNPRQRLRHRPLPDPHADQADPGNDHAAVRARQSGGRHPAISQHHHRHAGALQHQERRPLLQDPAAPGAASRSPPPKRTRRHDGRGKSPIREGQVGNRPGDRRPANQAAEAATGRRLPPRNNSGRTPSYDQQKLEIERAKVFVGASPAGPTAVDPIEAAKIGVDIHTAHLDAAMQTRTCR